VRIGAVGAFAMVAMSGESFPAAIPDLILLLKDEDKNVRIGAVATLGNMGESAKAAVPNLILLLQDRELCWRAIDALGNMGEGAKSAIPHLIPLLTDKDETIRSRAQSALEKLGYKR
jgi:HEAT repeat protein